jgi:hypothetical protein
MGWHGQMAFAVVMCWALEIDRHAAEARYQWQTSVA